MLGVMNSLVEIKVVSTMLLLPVTGGDDISRDSDSIHSPVFSVGRLPSPLALRSWALTLYFLGKI